MSAFMREFDVDCVRFDSIRSIIEDIPVIDIHSHLGTGGVWQARDLTDIMFYHWLGTELRNAGCPEHVCLSSQKGAELKAKDRVRIAVPYLRAIRNTSNYWAFMGIMSELYGIEEIDDHNWERAFEVVAERANEPTWETEVLRRARIEKVAIHAATSPRNASPYFNYLLGEQLYGVGLVSSAEAFEKVTGSSPKCASDLEQILVAHIERQASATGSTALHLWLPATWRYTETNMDDVEDLVKRWLSGVMLTDSERNRLSSFTANIVAREAGKQGLVVQVFHGSIAYEGGPQVTTWHPYFLRTLIVHVGKHPKTKFDLFLGTRAASHEATGLARLYPNLSVSGAWWHGFTPTTLVEFFRDRLEMLPMTRWNAFYSDAYCVEWCLGKLLVTKNRLAVALTGLVDEHLLDESDVANIAQAVLYENPKRDYLGATK